MDGHSDVFEREFSLEGRVVPLVLRRMTAREWAQFSVRFARLHVTVPIVRQPHEVGLSDHQRELLARHGQPLTPEQDAILTAFGLSDDDVRVMRRHEGTAEQIEAAYLKQEAENLANIGFAEQWVTSGVVSLDGLDGAAVWARYGTRADVWSRLLFALYSAHAIGVDERKNSHSPSGSTVSSDGSGETNTASGEKPAGVASGAVH